jgi:N,N-dimethylformamidase beta subunit-like protein
VTVIAGGKRWVYGSYHHYLESLHPAPVVRIQGIDCNFGRSSYFPGGRALLHVATDAPEITLQIFHAGPEKAHTAQFQMRGVPVTEPRDIGWRHHRSKPGSIHLRIGHWPNGIYFARLSAAEGRIGYAPFVVRPGRYGIRHVAVVLPTYTWQAYNFQDVNGDGWGDTWYAAPDIHRVSLRRPYYRGGAPTHWRNQALPFLHWLYRTKKRVDFLTDEDFGRFRRARRLFRLYDLIIFEGHEEYVTKHMYDLTVGYRNLGGHLEFLSSDNFFRRVDRHKRSLRLVGLWRRLGRPEARLIGVQYRANTANFGSYVVRGADKRPWVFAGTGLSDGHKWGNYGIEYDMKSRFSPTHTIVLAAVRPTRTSAVRGEMTYYKRGYAKVFAAGTLNFSGSAWRPPTRRILENLWARLSVR